MDRLSTCASVVALLLCCVAVVAEEPSLRSTGEWLVDLGRDYALSDRVAGTNDDGLIILSYMEAAARIDQACADAYLWQYDMLQALGRDAEARRALGHYVEHRPADVSARLLWLNLSLDELQTVEARTAFCRKWLDEPDLPPEVRAELLARLARVSFSRLEEKAGQAALSDALAADPHNPTACRLALAQRGDSDRVLTFKSLLASLEVNPLQPEKVWAVAQQLDGVGLHELAVAWYERSLEQFRRVDESFRPAARMLEELAAAYAASGRLNEALATCQKAIDAEPTSVSPRLMMVHIGRLLERNDLVSEQLSRIREQYAADAQAVEQARDGPRAAGIALFYAYHDPQPALAARWTALAREWAPELELTKIAAGFTALLGDHQDEALSLLEPHAGTSQLAAIGAARALIALGRRDEAGSVLEGAAQILCSGPYFSDITSLLGNLQRTVPPHPLASEMREAVASFDAGLFDMALNLRSSLKVVLLFDDVEPTVAEPLRCRLTLANVGERVIYFGQHGLLSPQVLLSVKTQGDRERLYPGYLWMSADIVPSLRPGQTIEMVQTIDVGALRRELFCTPQSAQQIELTGIVDAVPDAAGGWVPSATGLTVPAAKATRQSVPAGPSDIGRLLTGLQAADAGTRIASAMVLAALVTEEQLAEEGSLGYDRVTIDATSIIPALLRRAISDPLPHVRARVLDALRWYRLDPAHVSTLASMLSDSSWLVRMTACSVLADQQRAGFLPVLEGTSETDPDPLVRQLTGALARRIGSSRSEDRP